MPDDVEVCLVQLPGREERIGEPFFTEFTPLIETLADVLTPCFDRPFVLFGHSLGAFIAYELTCALRAREGPEPVHLILSGCRAPHIPERDPVHGLADQAFAEELRSKGGTPEAVLQSAELMNLLLPLLRADFTLAETYRSDEETPLSVPITTFGGTTDLETKRTDIEAWRLYTTSTFALRMFPGGHFFLKTAEDSVLRAIYEVLSRSLSDLGRIYCGCGKSVSFSDHSR